ncbi:MAG: class F sortase [Candidatus Saccharibacteria bacterium]|nr:class F sortase [Candidatus Saccharibacteria bacterium]
MAQQNILNNSLFKAGSLRISSRGTAFRHLPKKRKSPVTVQRNIAALPIKPRQCKSQVLQRRVTVAPKKTKIRNTTSIKQKALLSMAMTVFVVGLGVAGLGLRTNKHVAAQVATVAEKAKNSEEAPIPTEQKPTAAAYGAYTVDPTRPRYVRIAKIGVAARVMPQTTTKSGALKAPGNVNDAGWFTSSSKPGEGGAMLLDGHVAGPTQRGVFYNIKKLVAGDVIEVERGDGTVFRYKVVKSNTTDVADTDMSDALISAETGKQGLNLITCTGTYDEKSGEYNQRIIVFAVAI